MIVDAKSGFARRRRMSAIVSIERGANASNLEDIKRECRPLTNSLTTRSMSGGAHHLRQPFATVQAKAWGSGSPARRRQRGGGRGGPEKQAAAFRAKGCCEVKCINSKEAEEGRSTLSSLSTG